jgi:hypothetical protein
LNIYLCVAIIQQKNETKFIVARNIDSANNKATYYYASIKQLTEVDEKGIKNQNIKVCVYLNLRSCDNCNKQAILYLKRNFQDRYLSIYVDSAFKEQLPSINTKGIEVKFVRENDPFYNANNPFYFLNINGCKTLKYSHENAYPEITELYFTKIKSYFKN